MEPEIFALARRCYDASCFGEGETQHPITPTPFDDLPRWARRSWLRVAVAARPDLVEGVYVFEIDHWAAGILPTSVWAGAKISVDMVDPDAPAVIEEVIDISPLVDHAGMELRRAGLFDADSDYDGAIGDAVLELVQTFAAQGHSGYSSKLTLEVFDQVARYKPLGPLTADPAEWNEVTDPSNASGDRTWQSRRQSSCFSTDGGKTYYDIDGDREVIVTSANPQTSAGANVAEVLATDGGAA